MPSSIADPLFERLLRAFPADRPYAREDWSSAPMPEPVRHFLAQLLRHQSRHEADRLRRARTSWVDYDHPDMERAVRSFFAAVEDHMQVPRTEWEDTLHQATHHVTSYLVQPTHVLGEFVFSERDEALPLDQVMWRMNFFGPYAYLRNAVRAYEEQRDSSTFTRQGFERFLRRIDARITSDYTPDRWLRLLDPLFRLSQTAFSDAPSDDSTAPSGSVPLRSLHLFFQEKGADGIAGQIEEYGRNGRDRMSPKELHALLRGTSTASNTPAAPPLESRPSKAENNPSASPSPAASRPNANATASPNAQGDDAPNTEPTPSTDDAPASYSMEEVSRSTFSPPEPPSNASSPEDPETSTASETPASKSPSSASPSSASASAASDPESVPASNEDAPPEPDRLGERLDQDRDDIWGVDGSAREASSSETSTAGSGASPASPSTGDGSGDDGRPLWKQFQEGRSRSSADVGTPSNSETPLWARFQSDRERRGEAFDASAGADSAGKDPAGNAPSGTDPAGNASNRNAPDGSVAPEASDSLPTSASAPPSSSASSEIETLERSVLGDSQPPQRGVYVRQLFGDSIDHYHRVLRRLDDADSWGEASQIIAQDVFRKNKVNIYSDAAVHFTNAVESRFRD